MRMQGLLEDWFVNSASIEDLSFLDTVFPRLHRSACDRYESAHWLLCAFGAEVWRCDFGSKGIIELDWRVSVGERGGLLTSGRHEALWRALRSWLVLSTHSDIKGGCMWSIETEYARFSLALDWIDYFLLHADDVGLPDHGLMAITQDDLKEAICNVASSAEKSVGIYQWPHRVSAYLRSQCGSVSEADVVRYSQSTLFIAAELPDAIDFLTDLTPEEVIAARVFLWRNGFYKKGTAGRHSFKWLVNTKSLAAAVYPNTLRGRFGKPAPPELGLVPLESLQRECLAVPVADDSDKRMSELRIKEYRRVLTALGLLATVGLDVPVSALRAIDDRSVTLALNLKRHNRYRTLPAGVVFGSLRSAIEFSLTYAHDLTTSYLAIARAARDANLSIYSYARQYSIIDHLAPRVAEMGVCEWTIEAKETGLDGGPVALDKSVYFTRLRGNVGLWELLRVMYGAAQISVGTLLAPRVGELVDLISGSALDESSRYLLCDNRKSGVAGNRDTVAKPIPSVAVKVIRELERLQDGLIELGLIDRRSNLFAYPTAHLDRPLVQLPLVHFNRSIDYFCDYFETQLDAFGRRYYIRQHQLRRFFAMLFFWSNSFGGLDTLRHFMGHTSSEHIYRYITESTPGALLRSVKAEWASEAVKLQWEAAQDLADLVAVHFHTRNFRVLADEELTEYIEDLIEQGLVAVEPEFLDGEGKYRILIKVSPMGL
jgi:hypothetical protein